MERNIRQLVRTELFLCQCSHIAVRDLLFTGQILCLRIVKDLTQKYIRHLFLNY